MRGYPEVCVGVLVFNDEGEVLLLKSHKWHGRYIVPSGHIELGESVEDAARREVKEETGLDIAGLEFLKIDELINSPQFHEPRHFVCINFRCVAKEGAVVLNDEAESYVWLRPEEALRQDLDSITRRSIERVLP